MTIISNPPGATVYLDKKEIGRTPFSTNFDHYGKREFRVVKQGYETKTELVSVPAPWYQWVGFDFVSEVLLPGKLTDNKYYEFDLQPEKVPPGSEIVMRGDEFRRIAHADGIPNSSGATSVVQPSTIGSLDYPVPNVTPVVPSASVFTPPSTPSQPNTYVPPPLQPRY